jgi:hypothetical protein
MLGIYFGSQGIAQSSNLNWLDYHGGTYVGNGKIEDKHAVWANFISNCIH